MSFPSRKIIDVVLAGRVVQEEGKVYISDIASEYNSTMMMMRLPTIIDENDRRWLRTVITASKKKEEKEKKERNQHTRSNTYVNGRRRSRR